MNARYAERPALITLLNDFFDGVNERRALQRAATVLARDTSDRAIRVIILVDELESADLNVRLQSLEQLRALLLGRLSRHRAEPNKVNRSHRAVPFSKASLHRRMTRQWTYKL